MKRAWILPILPAVLASILYGIGFPFCKLFLDQVDPIPLLAFISLGEGLGLWFLRVFQPHRQREASISRLDWPWLLGAIACGGVVAPALALIGLNQTPAVVASLLLNFEIVATVLLAALIFKEAIGRQVWLAVLCVVAGSLLLSLDFSSPLGISLGALIILSATIVWALNRNLARNISGKDPLQIMIIRGFAAGVITLLLTAALAIPMPSIGLILEMMALGFGCFGLGYVLELLALRQLGTARTGAIVSTSPFVGTIIATFLFQDRFNPLLLLVLPLMALGVFLIVVEHHSHLHLHLPFEHEHRHRHDDGHHEHSHSSGAVPAKISHSHLHRHEALEHYHPHSPDLHHRHLHTKREKALR